MLQLWTLEQNYDHNISGPTVTGNAAYVKTVTAAPSEVWE